MLADVVRVHPAPAGVGSLLDERGRHRALALPGLAADAREPRQACRRCLARRGQEPLPQRRQAETVGVSAEQVGHVEVVAERLEQEAEAEEPGEGGGAAVLPRNLREDELPRGWVEAVGGSDVDRGEGGGEVPRAKAVGEERELV